MSVLTVTTPPWMDRAQCVGTDPEAFFPEPGANPNAARRLCTACPVRTECLEYALEHDERFGVWGGKSPEQRERIQRSRAPREQRPGYCGKGRHWRTEANTGIDHRGHRYCKTCQREYFLNYSRKKATA